MKIIKIELELKNVLIILGVIALIFFIFELKDIVSIFAISFFIAYLLDPVIDMLEKLKLSRSLAILMIFILFAVLVTILLIYLIPVIYSEIIYLISAIPRYADLLLDKLTYLNSTFGLNISIDTVKPLITSKLETISKFMLTAIMSFSGSLYNFITGMINLFLVPILAFYFLKDFDFITSKSLDLLTKKIGIDFHEQYDSFNNILKKYFRGQVIVALCLMLLYSIVLLIAGIKTAVLIGSISGILSIVPYLGFVVGFSTSIIMAYLQYTDWLHPLIVIIGFSVVQAIEGNILTPRFVGKSLGLHPTAVIFSLLAGGYLLGIGGMIISLPLAAFIKVAGKRLLDNLGDNIFTSK